MITVSKYAKQCGVSVQAVNQTIRRYKANLEGHIIMERNVRYLDDDAVQFLNEHRKYGNSTVEYAPQKEEPSADNEMLTKLTKAYEAIIALQEERAKLLKENTELKLLITTNKDAETPTEAAEAPTSEDSAEGIETTTETTETPTEAPDASPQKQNRFVRAWKAFTSKE